MGGGILAKMDFLQTGPCRFCLEGSAHTGTLANEYDSNDLTDKPASAREERSFLFRVWAGICLAVIPGF